MSSNKDSDANDAHWTFFTNHFHVLLFIAQQPGSRLRTIADEVGITERAAHRILGQLASAGYITITKTGRRNTYHVTPSTTLRHRANVEVPLEPLIELVNARANYSHVTG
jgi:DNA-binding MarR family transcriptional regulator